MKAINLLLDSIALSSQPLLNVTAPHVQDGANNGDIKVIDYSKTNRGDILRVVGAGAPGYAKLGDLVRVAEVTTNGVMVEDRHGLTCEFVFNCGAARLEPTEWTKDFPDQQESGAAPPKE